MCDEYCVFFQRQLPSEIPASRRVGFEDSGVDAVWNDRHLGGGISAPLMELCARQRVDHDSCGRNVRETSAGLRGQPGWGLHHAASEPSATDVPHDRRSPTGQPIEASHEVTVIHPGLYQIGIVRAHPAQESEQLQRRRDSADSGRGHRRTKLLRTPRRVRSSASVATWKVNSRRSDSSKRRSVCSAPPTPSPVMMCSTRGLLISLSHFQASHAFAKEPSYANRIDGGSTCVRDR